MSLTTRVLRNARRRGVKVYNRKQWGCPNITLYHLRKVTRRHKAPPSDTMWYHITVTPRRGIKHDMRILHQIGVQRFGSGVSYNWAVDHVTGEVGLGAALEAKGTHTINDKNIPNYSKDQNYVSLAIAVIAMPGAVPSDRCVRSVVKLIAAHIEEGALTVGHDFNPHSMVAWKDCPTDPMRADMPIIEKLLVKELERSGKRKRRRRKRNR